MRLTTSIADCTLRPWQADDRASLVRHANDRDVWRNLVDTFPHPYTDADARAWIDVATTNGPDLHWAIDRAGEAIGGISAIAGSGVFRATAQIGYWLGRAHWGQGVATACLIALVDHLATLRRFARLEARVFAWNAASMRVLEHAGFGRDALLRRSVIKDGALIDSVVYARLLDSFSLTNPS